MEIVLIMEGVFKVEAASFIILEDDVLSNKIIVEAMASTIILLKRILPNVYFMY